MKMKRFAVALLLVAGMLGNVFSASVGINFVGKDWGGVDLSNSTLLPTESVGAVESTVNWNNLSGAIETNSVLYDENGVNSGLSVVWASDTLAEAGRTNASADNAMMNGCLVNDWGANGISVSVSNVTQFLGTYDVYVYVGGNDASIGSSLVVLDDSVTNSYRHHSSSELDFPADYILDDSEWDYANYIVYSGLTNDQFSISLENDRKTAHLYGIQIVKHVPPVRGNAIGLNFVGKWWGGVDLSNRTLLPEEFVGAVESTAYWNNLEGAVETNNYLYDNNGVDSEVSVVWMADQLSDAGRTNAAGDNAMMNGCLLDDFWNGISVSVSNMTQFAATYDVYVYVGGSDDSLGLAHVMLDAGLTNYYSHYSSGELDFPSDYVLGEATNAPPNWASYVDANYVVFSGLTNDQFTISLDNERKDSKLFGIQIVNTNPSLEPGYDAWAERHELEEGAHGDDDGDGYSNIWEYAMEGDPNDASDWGVTPSSAVAETDGTNWFLYVYPEHTDPDHGLIYSLEVTDDLVSNVWTNDGYEVTGSNVVDTLNYITNRVSMEGKPQQFIKLGIDQE